MQRRSFIKSLIACSVAPMWLPGGGRLWKATLATPAFNCELYTGTWFFVYDQNGLVSGGRISNQPLQMRLLRVPVT